MAADQRKLRILCLHGFTQNAEVFRQRTGALRKFCKAHATFEFMDAPFLAPKENIFTAPSVSSEEHSEAGGGGDNGASSPRAWWRDRSSLHGLHDSVAAVAAFAAERGPFDGLLGFSQGACMAAALCALQEAEGRGEETGLPALGFRVRFALFVSGFVPTGESAAVAAFRGAAAAPITSLPTLHVLGRADEVIVPDRCRALAQACSEAEVVEHEGAHHVPSSRAVRDAVRTFLAARRELS